LAGATYGFAAACRTEHVGFSLGAVIDAEVRAAAEVLNANDGWYPTIDSDGGVRAGAWAAEATELVDLSQWPPGARLILRAVANVKTWKILHTDCRWPLATFKTAFTARCRQSREVSV
jgi:hypothetical protein